MTFAVVSNITVRKRWTFMQWTWRNYRVYARIMASKQL